MAITKIDSSMYEDVSGANNLVKLDANAKIPAGAATNLTNLPGVIKSSSDPTISSNKAVGTQWANTTSGELYVCTDATAGANVWTNVGEGTDNIAPYYYQGTTYGYTHGGEVPPDSNVIDKFSFTSDANATDVGDLTVAMDYCSGSSSETYGYSAGRSPAPQNTICKYSFATDGNATDVGDMTTPRNSPGGVTSPTHGYVIGGYQFTPAGVSGIKDKYSFATDGNATNVGTLSVTRLQTGGHTDTVYGYNTSGANGVTYYNVIDRWQFASEANSVDVGDMTVAEHRAGGSSSLTHGYCTGGSGLNVIDKFAFSSSATGTDVGDIPGTTNMGNSGHSSTTHGYATSVSTQVSNQICKYSFTTDGNSTDVGDLTVARSYVAGTHV